MNRNESWIQSVLNQFPDQHKVGSIENVGGGSISQAWKVQTDSPPETYFVKQNRIDFLDNFRAERDGLESLSSVAESIDGLEVPEVLFVGEVEGEACLVLRWIDSSVGRVDEFQYGRMIAKLHTVGATASDTIGYVRNNYLGATVQVNTPPRSVGQQGWIDFVAEHRLGFQIAIAQDRRVASRRLIEGVKAIIDRLPDLLEGRLDDVALLHGDLWGGNVLFGTSGNVVLIDPAVYHGCPEAEFGMIKLFGGVGSAFEEGYQSELKFPDGWQRRVDVYVLYHLLNHLNLFGAGYLNQCERLALRVARA